MIIAMTVEQVRERIPCILSRPEDDALRIAEEFALLYDVMATIAAGNGDARELAEATMALLPGSEESARAGRESGVSASG